MQRKKKKKPHQIKEEFILNSRGVSLLRAFATSMEQQELNYILGVIGVVLELKRAKSHKPVQFPHLDFDSVETTESFPLATGRFEAGSL
ncbi:uncharacterized protein LOC109948300 isoform X2 [Prunus persica]|uniref:uncharacterized protein LOC109948300 isoform X2 n=1 Tax=Prunus persica TaxID=3760 RepID=UPI0009AB54AE|nr:uncharacterized protein LOC109948300 isoform X2 [Prunus persica]